MMKDSGYMISPFAELRVIWFKHEILRVAQNDNIKTNPSLLWFQ
jgi:hypothetical protein